MKRLFKMKIHSPKILHRDIMVAYRAACDFYCTYSSAVMPNQVGLYPGLPGPSGFTEQDYDLDLLKAMRDLIDQSIKNHEIVKSGVHPLDNVPDSPEFDGCDGPYSLGLFERPKVWPEKSVRNI